MIKPEKYRRFKSEEIFRKKMIETGFTLKSQPESFLNEFSYRPDFYCVEEDTYYEVIGSASSFDHNVQKYAKLILLRPEIKFKVVYPSGKTYADNDEILMIAKGQAFIPLGPIRFPVDLIESLRLAAKDDGRTIANMIRLAVREYLGKKEINHAE